ncbi:hypothetical protein AOXY_G28485 [Acipenser oxyrinchus oxyrinchus]|uniref:Galaxin-like repeats domain-containing protein n=1 Tax=Acipenser oxyrinchus oxyrinchus TaxID=40147 RepID=A0AAD8CMV0_ACIOX|nr:hypothetical protein AOXY_G28485 [Acipenser oxyrinchus oxyrinchus]
MNLLLPVFPCFFVLSLFVGYQCHHGHQPANMRDCKGKQYNIKFQVCCEDGRVLPGSPDVQCCGNTTFDPSSHTCCHGYVSPGGGLSCCGQIAYSRTNASCCAGQLSTDYNEMVSQCCGTKAYYHTYDLCCGDELYNLTTHTCCGAEQNIILKKNTPNEKCCGSELFNEDTHTCSADMTIISKGSSMEGTSQKITTLNLYSSKGKNSYDPTMHRCCSGQLCANTEDCCGNKCLDRNTHICCGNRVAPRIVGNATKCCGDGIYNSFELACCRNKVVKDKSCRIKENLSPCGWATYFDPKMERCCINKTSNKGVVYRANQTCCEGIVSSTPGTGLNGGQCCNSKGYNPNLDMCCSGMIHTLKPGIRQECCGGSAYDIKASVCCNGTLYQVTDGDTVCSGGFPFNPTKETVCGKVTHESGQHCCGNHVFKPLTEICCRGKSHPRTNTELLCCGSQPYNPANSSFKCCNGKLHALSRHPRSWGCCGEGLIDLQTHECCSSKDQHLVFKKDSAFSCCGHHHYKTSQDSCCAGRLIQKHKQTQSTEKACRLVHIADIEDSTVCNKRVLMGRMHSVAIQRSRRVYVMIDVLEVMKNKSAVPLSHPTIITVNHCLCPLLNLGATYALWIPHNMNIDSLTLENSVEMAELSHLESCPVYTILQIMNKLTRYSIYSKGCCVKRRSRSEGLQPLSQHTPRSTSLTARHQPLTTIPGITEHSFRARRTVD